MNVQQAGWANYLSCVSALHIEVGKSTESQDEQFQTKGSKGQIVFHIEIHSFPVQGWKEVIELEATQYMNDTCDTKCGLTEGRLQVIMNVHMG